MIYYVLFTMKLEFVAGRCRNESMWFCFRVRENQNLDYAGHIVPVEVSDEEQTFSCKTLEEALKTNS